MTIYLKNSWMLIIGLCACTLSNSDNSAGSRLIRNANGEALADIYTSSEEVSVNLPAKTLRGVAKRSDKRKYYDGSTMAYAVKMDDDGFKLRDESERLLWKIKLYEDKLKIANNEEMHGAYEIKLREEGKLKLEKNEKELKSIRLSATSEWYEVEGGYSIKGFGVSLAPGILLINDLKDTEKFIIMAELVNRNR